MSVAIQKMFDGISGKYDFLNHFLSAGRDIRWRKKAVSFIPKTDSNKVLDLCGGTGDFIHEFKGKHGNLDVGVVGDFSYGMLDICRKKFNQYDTVQLDALNIPYEEKKFNVVLNGFGMRNLDSLEGGVKEVNRVMEKDGYFVTLEFFKPKSITTLIFYYVLAPLFIPLFGALFSGKKDAYEYLVNSVKKFASTEDYKEMLQRNGFEVKRIKACDTGIAHIVVAKKVGDVK